MIFCQFSKFIALLSVRQFAINYKISLAALNVILIFVDDREQLSRNFAQYRTIFSHI